MWNLSKVNNKDARMTTMISFWFFIVNFEYISYLFVSVLLLTGKCLLYIYIYIFLKCKASNCSKDKPDQLNRSFVYETDEVFIFSTSDDTEDDILWLSSVSD